MNKESNIFVHLYKNGAVAAYSQGTAPFNATDQASQVSMIVDLDSDDYMELYVYQNGGSTKQCDSGSDTDHTYMGGFRIAGTT